MNENGLCPLFSYNDGDSIVQSKCKKDDCAWWDGTTDLCIVFAIKNSLDELEYTTRTQ